MVLSSIFCALGLILIAGFYRNPSRGSGVPVPASSWPPQSVFRAVLIAGCIWGLFNAAVGMIFGFGTTMLVERCWSLAEAGSATSLVLWIVTISSPMAGFLADRTGKHIEMMLAGFVLFAIALLTANRTDAVIPAFVALGLAAAVPVGPIMSLPARVLNPQVRAVGMGIYFTLFYVFVVAAPIVAGCLSSQVATAAVAFDLGASMLALCIPVYWVFRHFATRTTLAPASTVEIRHGI